MSLLDNLCYDTSSDCVSAFADSEAETIFHCDWSDELNSEIVHVVTWHDHFGAGQEIPLRIRSRRSCGSKTAGDIL